MSFVPFADPGTPESACHNARPSVACRLFWNVTHNRGMTEFFGQWLDVPITRIVQIIIIFTIALLVRRLAHRMISTITLRMAEGTMSDRVRERTRTIFDGSPALVSERRRQRTETLGSVLRSIASIIILGTALFTALAQIGLNITPVLASATVVGMAVGFGAQNVVKDFLAGLFMLLEDQYGVGDVIDVGQAKGTVEAVTLRVTRLRDVNGVVWYVRNGEIMRVGNESQNWARAVLDIPVGYAEDTDKVKSLLKTASSELATDPAWSDDILEEPAVWGVQELTTESMIVRLVIKTSPGRQGDVAREMRARVKKAFDAAGIAISTPATE